MFDWVLYTPQPMEIYSYSTSMRSLKAGFLPWRQKIFAKSNFFLILFKKITNICLADISKCKYVNFNKVNSVFFKSMLICASLWRFVLLITFKIWTQKYCFVNDLTVFLKNSGLFLAKELRRYKTIWITLKNKKIRYTFFWSHKFKQTILSIPYFL